MRPVDIVIPVCDGEQETVACLASVLRSVDDDWARIIVINDCSSNRQITEYLRQLDARQSQLVLLENEKNLGFVATANRGMAYDDERDVMLLNGEIEVAGDWLYRLREAAYHHELVASVTPFSNNATISSFPNICEDNRLIFGLSLDEIDAQFAANFCVDDVFQVPTGAGCCMYIRRDCLNDIGFFDVATFGRDYGEVDDWCQRAARAGWCNLHLANCFVYHKGGVGFGSDDKPGVARTNGVSGRKYSRYHADIRDYIARNPAREVRTVAWLQLFAAENKPKVLMVSHELGGGVQQHVEELVQLLGDKALFLLMMPGKGGETVRLSCFDGKQRLQDGLVFDVATDYDKLVDLLQGVGIGRVHFHHTMGLPIRLWRLLDDLGCDYDLTIHDYYLINGNLTLTGKDGRYVSEALPDFDQQCAGHYPLPEGIEGDQWRANQRSIVEDADRIIFPSVDCSERFQKFFDVTNPIAAWHVDYAGSSFPAPQWNFPADRPLRVLVLGALSREKGADVLEEVASGLVGNNIEFHLLGYAYRKLDASVISHGPYDNKKVNSLVEDIAPDVVWFPAMWPETYSYTLSVALHNGLPVVVPDIGAFAERVQGRPHSAVVNWNKSTAQWLTFWKAILHDKALPGFDGQSYANCRSADNDFYFAQYLQAVPVRLTSTDFRIPDNLERHLYTESSKLSRSERILNGIWIFTRQPMVAKLISIVPFRMQRSIKRFLSRRPMHDIMGK